MTGHTLFVPMPLTYSCWNTDCGDGTMACKGNTCVDSTMAESALVDYDKSLLDGTDVCFDPAKCFGGGDAGPTEALAPELVDYDSCTYAFPGPAPLGLNVRVYYQTFTWSQDPSGRYFSQFKSGGESEILSEDATEGFIPLAADAGFGTQFKLAPGLCALVHQAQTPPAAPATGTGSYITISDLRVTNQCPPKTPLLPICAGQQTNTPSLPSGTSTDGTCNVPVPLAPTPSALYIAMDHSDYMYGAFGANGAATLASLSLTDPVFSRTYAAFNFLSDNPADCSGGTDYTTFSPPGVDFDLAATVQPKMAMALAAWTPTDAITTTACTNNADCTVPGQLCANQFCITPNAMDLQGACRSDTGVYARIASFLQGGETPNLATAMFFVNRAPDTTNDCPPTFGPTVKASLEAEITTAFNETPSIQTNFVVLGNDSQDTSALAFYQGVQSDLPQAVQVLDATQPDPDAVALNFANLVTQLGTCLYDYDSLPTGTSPTSVLVQYTLPEQSPVTIPFNANCSPANQSAVDGWNLDNGRLRVCGNSCDQLRNGIVAASGAAAQQMLAAPNIPVTATIVCAGGAPESDAGPGSSGSGSGGSGSVAGSSSGSGGAGVSTSGSSGSSSDGTGDDGGSSFDSSAPGALDAGIMAIGADAASLK